MKGRKKTDPEYHAWLIGRLSLSELPTTAGEFAFGQKAWLAAKADTAQSKRRRVKCQPSK